LQREFHDPQTVDGNQFKHVNPMSASVYIARM
jgi:hypothetical protein